MWTSTIVMETIPPQGSRASPSTPSASVSSSSSSLSSSSTSTNSSLAKSHPSQQTTKWQTFKMLLPSSAATQTIIGLLGLILTILGVKWAVDSYNMARWTMFKDFRDDCRSVRDSGGHLSLACDTALERELEPPPYLSASFDRLVKRGYEAAQTGPLLIFLPWALDGVALLTALALQSIGSFYHKRFVFAGLMLLRNLVSWPLWSINCHGIWYGLTTLSSNVICFAIISLEHCRLKSRRATQWKIVLSVQHELLLWFELVLHPSLIGCRAFSWGIAGLWMMCLRASATATGKKIDLEDVAEVLSLTLVSHGVQFSFFMFLDLIWVLAPIWVLEFTNSKSLR